MLEITAYSKEGGKAGRVVRDSSRGSKAATADIEPMPLANALALIAVRLSNITGVVSQLQEWFIHIWDMAADLSYVFASWMAFALIKCLAGRPGRY